jgi:hypothetical protein
VEPGVIGLSDVTGLSASLNHHEDYVQTAENLSLRRIPDDAVLHTKSQENSLTASDNL